MLKKKIIIDFESPKVRKNIIIVGVALMVLIATLVYFVISGLNFNAMDNEENLISTSDAGIEESEEQNGSIYVDVSGAVKEPSVILLSEGSRVFEAIEAAGGLTEDANLSEINRAEIVEDGAYIYIPTNKEVQENTVPSGGIGNSGVGTAGSGTASNSQGKININTADSTTLQQLNGVGPSTADKIINYRTSNGRFNSIEDIKNVSGIGDKTFEKLAPYIKV